MSNFQPSFRTQQAQRKNQALTTVVDGAAVAVTVEPNQNVQRVDADSAHAATFTLPHVGNVAWSEFDFSFVGFTSGATAIIKDEGGTTIATLAAASDFITLISTGIDWRVVNSTVTPTATAVSLSNTTPRQLTVDETIVDVTLTAAVAAVVELPAVNAAIGKSYRVTLAVDSTTATVAVKDESGTTTYGTLTAAELP